MATVYSTLSHPVVATGGWDFPHITFISFTDTQLKGELCLVTVYCDASSGMPYKRVCSEGLPF